MRNRRNYYRILHVQPDAPVEIIRASYRTMMQKLAQHPDLGGDHWNSTLINEAKMVLTDPAKRFEYDQELMAFHTLFELSGRTQGVQQQEKTGGRDSSKKRYKPIIKHYCSFCKSPHKGNSQILPDTKCTQCESPLYPVEKMKTDKYSQRAANRIEKHQEVSYFIYWPPQKMFKGQIQDLSPNGMRFITDQQLIEDHIIKIDSPLLQATARVTNRQKHRADTRMFYSIGVEFVTLHFKKSYGTFVSVKA